MADIKETNALEIKKMNIFEKLSAVLTEITNVEKNLTVGKQGSQYKAVSEADVLSAVRTVEAKYRIYSYPSSRRIIESGTVDSTRYDGSINHQLWERIETTYRFVNMDKPEEFIEITSYGDGIDSGDKSVGKAMTYADKYALLKAYKIVTGEDPDQEESRPLASAQKETRPKSQVKPQQPRKEGVTESLVKDLETLGSSLEKVAKYKGMEVKDLTDEIVSPILTAMKKKRAAEKGNNVTENVQPASESNTK